MDPGEEKQDSQIISQFDESSPEERRDVLTSRRTKVLKISAKKHKKRLEKAREIRANGASKVISSLPIKRKQGHQQSTRMSMTMLLKGVEKQKRVENLKGKLKRKPRQITKGWTPTSRWR